MPWTLDTPGTIARRILKHPVSTVASGTVLGQIALAAATPMLTRAYTPDAWGRLGLYSALAAVGSTVVGLQLEQAIVNTRTDREARTLFTMSLLSAALLTTVLLCGAEAARSLDLLPGRSLPAAFFPTAALAVFLLHVFNALRMCAIREQEYRLTGRAVLSQNVARAVMPLALAWPFPSWLGLVVGDVLARLAGLVLLGRFYFRRFGRLFVPVRRTYLLTVWRRNRVFATVGVASAFINALALSLPLPLAAITFGSADAGYYMVVQRILQAPLLLIGSAVADVFHGRSALYNSTSPHYLLAFFLRASVRLALLSLTFGAVVILVGSDRIAGLLGPGWQPASELLLVLLPWPMMALVVSPLTRIVPVLRGQRGKLVYDLASLSLILASFGIGASKDWSMVRTVALVSYSQVLAYAIYWLILLRLIQTRSAQRVKRAGDTNGSPPPAADPPRRD